MTVYVTVIIVCLMHHCPRYGQYKLESL